MFRLSDAAERLRFCRGAGFSPSAVRQLVTVCRRDDYLYSSTFCLRAETRCSCSSSMMRCSSSHRRDRRSHSHCCSHDQRHGTEPLCRQFQSFAGGGRSRHAHALRFRFSFCFSYFIFTKLKITATLCALTLYSAMEISPLKASRDPKYVPEYDDAPLESA